MDLADSKQQASRMLAVRRQDDTVVRKPSYEGPIVWGCDVP
jgi:CTP-dependent riboflavin kinase